MLRWHQEMWKADDAAQRDVLEFFLTKDGKKLEGRNWWMNDDDDDADA